ncbi:hypothetical protein EXIGLDRAFT_758622 [Exidia glandulosa HHB12029]|uniref:Uncharacterized protein n=1 Tax=Exidia glandulosa HHB12029 TaxID=1314781 RepID=A0A165R0P1_EXIGL|nr:hypothetical protein EXIGLDRAFT_758622 [Exidia glandulosa HHB12029]
MAEDADDAFTLLLSWQTVTTWEPTLYPAPPTDDPVPPQRSPRVLTDFDNREKRLRLIQDALNEPVSAPLSTHSPPAAASGAPVTSTSAENGKEIRLRMIQEALGEPFSDSTALVTEAAARVPATAADHRQ